MEEYLANEKRAKIPCIDQEVLAEDGKIGGMSDHIFAISQVRCKQDGHSLEEDTATGFFYKNDEDLYFITIDMSSSIVLMDSARTKLY